MVYKDPDYQKNYRAKNKEKHLEYQAKCRKDLKQHATESIKFGKIIDANKWDLWCKQIKIGTKNHPYSVNFTNDIIFKMMIKGCFYCGDLATTIDRIDSKLDHTLKNCIGSCYGCNISKGAADPSTFIKKAYYRSRGKYYDDDIDIWFVHKNKPRIDTYNKHANIQGVPFELIQDVWDKLIKGDCAYCKRSPTTWFGVDRVVPSKGYVLDNVASCCYDCNLDKFEYDIEMMKERNERIAQRIDSGKLCIDKCKKVILHRGKQKTSKKVCVYGKIYESMTIASMALVMGESYIKNCIYKRRYFNDIFIISDKFYKEYKDSELYITHNMSVAFDHFYTSA